jgi:hypothetical protein
MSFNKVKNTGKDSIHCADTLSNIAFIFTGEGNY